MTFAAWPAKPSALRNQGRGIADNFGRRSRSRIGEDGRAAPERCTIAAAFGCPFEGEVAGTASLELVEQIAEIGADEIGLADTIGVGTPGQVERSLRGRGPEAPPGVPLRAHFHNTRNTGFANADAALRCRRRGSRLEPRRIGGCPFAPRATGNIATEDLVYLLDGMGITSGLDGRALASMDPWLAELLGHPVPGSLGKADWFA